MPKVNLDALIPREDFPFGNPEGLPLGNKQASIKPLELEPANLFLAALRKPDFQRETTEWPPERVFGLIKTFMDGDLIPAVILWRNNRLNYVIDGSHRLGALIAWVHDDYGDGPRSVALFADAIKEDQRRVARKTRELVNEQIGSYKDLQSAGLNPSAYPAALVARARDLSVLALPVQWIEGTTVKAEESFIRINQQAAAISPQELLLITNRRFPTAIAARAILRRAMGHQYWGDFEQAKQDKIKTLATDSHDLLFNPPTEFPISSPDLAIGGPAYSGEALGMVYDFVNLCNRPSDSGSASPSVDADGSRTIRCLSHAQDALRLMASKHESSLALHPIVYFYSWAGRHAVAQLLTVADFFLRLQAEDRLIEFCELRAKFEDYLVANRDVLYAVMRAQGSRASRRKAAPSYYLDVLDALRGGCTPNGVVPHLIGLGRYKFLARQDVPQREGKPGAHFSKAVKSGTKMRALISTALRCAECNGYLPNRYVSWDHAEGRAMGGSNAASNVGLVHPYCNTAYKPHKEKIARSVASQRDR